MKRWKIGNFFRTSVRGVRFLYGANRKMLLAYACGNLLHGASWALQVVFMQRFLDTAQSLYEGGAEIREALFSLVWLGAVYMFSQVMNGVVNCYGFIYDRTATKEVDKAVFQRCQRLPPEEYEKTVRLDEIDKAVNGGKSAASLGMTLLDTVFYYGAYFLIVGGYLSQMNAVLGWSVVAIFIPCLFSKFLQGRVFGKAEDASAPYRRKSEYYEKCLTEPSYLKETRLLGINFLFENRLRQAEERLSGLKWKAGTEKFRYDMAGNLVNIMGYGVILYLLFISVMTGEISIGAYAAVLASINRVQSFMEELIFELLEYAFESLASVDNFYAFLDEKQTERIERLSEFPAVHLEKVSYRYPMAEKEALNDISLDVKAGEIVAVVGENGSGKTTLCRLISGLYEPTTGEIYCGGAKASALDGTGISAVFQNFCRYQMTLSENIRISCGEKAEDYSEDKMEELCREVGLSVDARRFPEKLDTMLGRYFEGTELSGGEWQRVAIARGTARHSLLIVMDEPTSAIDPFEESALYHMFRKTAEGKTAFLVTHRLGMARIADRIIVMKNGRIVQDGRHDDLAAVEGEYKRMYEAQSAWYR